MELLKWKKNKANGCRLGIPEGALAFEELAEERCPKPQTGEQGQGRRGEHTILGGKATKAPRKVWVPA